MADNSSLYGSTPPTGTVSSSNYTTLYNGNGNYVPGGDNVIISGTLTVNGCAILTDCSTFSLLPANATTINFGGSATAMNIGATSGLTTILNQLATTNYKFPVADGANTQVLATDGNGVLYWANNNDFNTTYTIDASTTTGGANFNLAGSDSSLDTIKFANGSNMTISRTDANTITFNSSYVNTTYTQNSAATTGGANLNLVGSDSTTDAVKFAEGAGISVVSTDANTITITNTSANTLYNIDASATTGGANFNLTGSDSSLDTIKFANGTGMSIVRTDANTITFTNTAPDVNTTYTQNASATTGGANLNLVGSDGTTDPVKFASGTGITVSRTDADTITITNTAPDTNTTYTIDAAATTGGANINLLGSDGTTDTIKVASGSGITVTQTNTGQITVTNAAPAVPYNIDATATTGGANLNLNNADGTDSVAFKGTGATTVTRSSADLITISSTDTNTTYSQNASATTGGANLNLVGSDGTTDAVTFQSGTNVTVAQVDANTINISTTGITPTDVQQVFATVRNQQGSTITIGQVVYLDAATGNTPTVKLANNSGDATSAKSLGLVYSSSINNGAQGLVITQGLITGVNTVAFAEGDSLYLGSTPGSVTNVKPHAPQHLVYIGVVVKSNVSTGQIFVRVQNGYELGEIHDVDLVTNPPTNNQVLTYNSSTALWTAQNTQNIFNQSLNTTNSVAFAGLNVDSGTLYVDPTNNRVGINTTSPIYELDVRDGGDGYVQFALTNTEREFVITNNAGDDLVSISVRQPAGSGSYANRLQFDATGGNQWFASGYLGVNNSAPAYTLDVGGDIKVGGDTIYNSYNEKLIDYAQLPSIYGIARQANFQATDNIGVRASFINIDGITEFNTTTLTTSATTADQVLAYWDPTTADAIKTLIKVQSGGQTQCIEVLMVQNGTNISLNTYGDVRTAGNLTTVSSGYNATTGYWELRVTPVNAVTVYTSNHQIMY